MKEGQLGQDCEMCEVFGLQGQGQLSRLVSMVFKAGFGYFLEPACVIEGCGALHTCSPPLVVSNGVESHVGVGG